MEIELCVFVEIAIIFFEHHTKKASKTRIEVGKPDFYHFTMTFQLQIQIQISSSNHQETCCQSCTNGLRKQNMQNRQTMRII